MENEPLYLMDIYKRNAKRYSIYAVATIVVLVLVSYILPQTWNAKATIMPPDSKTSGGALSALLAGADIPIGLAGPENKVATVFVEVLNSRTVREGIIDSLKLISNPLFAGRDRSELIKELEDLIAVSTKKSGLITIEAEVHTGWFAFGDEPHKAAILAADIANMGRVVLDKINREKAVSQAKKTRMYIERVLGKTRANIDSLQSVMQKFQQENKVLVLDEQVQAIVGNAVDIGAQLARAQVQLALYEQDFRNSSPQLDAVRKQVSVLEAQYAKVQQGGLVSTDGFSIPLEKAPALMRSYGNMLRDIKIQEQLNIYLESQRMQEMIQEEKDSPTVIELDHAVPDKDRSSPSRKIIVGISIIVALLGFFIGLPAIYSIKRRFSQM